MVGQSTGQFQMADVAPEPHDADQTPPVEPAAEELHTGTENGEGHAPKPGLPQLDATTFASQLFWLIISLVVLYTVLSRLALPKIQSVLAERHGRIKGDLDAAAQAKRDSEAAIAGYEKALVDARARALKTSDQIRNTVNTEINAKNDTAAKQLALDTAKAEAGIAEMRRQAMVRVGDVARETAADIIAKLTGETANAGDVEAAVAIALKQT